ncbi:MAG: hypothetical protein QM726_08945 [Chitinophagaceae bacterium]
MQLAAKSFLVILLILICFSGFSQKQSFDVVSFEVPKSWQQKQNDAAIQLSAIDNKTGAYAMAIITKATASTASASENFTNQWNAAIKTQVQLDGVPVMQAPSKGNGWEIITGNAGYTDNGVKGNVALMSATGGGQTVSVVIMTNTKQYEKELTGFLNSLELSKPLQNAGNGITAAPNANGAGSSSLTGLWVNYQSESSGYMNGMPMLTAGYFRHEYLFNADGTYIYRAKNWSAYMKEVLFVYETGTWSVNGNRLTITPKKGNGEWWSKAASNKTNEWGSRIKASAYKLETVTYTFDLHYYSGSKETALLLQNNQPTEREGRSNSNNQPNNWSYSPRVANGSLIDNPPGTKIGFENNTGGSSAVQKKTVAINDAVSSPLTGKIWEGTSSEKFVGAGASTGYNTGGFSTGQYKFNTDGTYRFVNVRASHYTDTKTLEYETGNWSIKGDQLNINPAKGQNEEWSKIGKTSNGNSDVANRAINETWGKKLKTNARKLEAYTYTFKVDKNGNNIALILQRNSRTEREGEGKISYYNETAPDKSVKLPNEIK